MFPNIQLNYAIIIRLALCLLTFPLQNSWSSSKLHGYFNVDTFSKWTKHWFPLIQAIYLFDDGTWFGIACSKLCSWLVWQKAFFLWDIYLNWTVIKTDDRLFNFCKKKLGSSNLVVKVLGFARGWLSKFWSPKPTHCRVKLFLEKFSKKRKPDK